MSDQRKNIWFDLLWLSVAIVIIFGFMLGCRALSVPDEARYTEIPREMLLLHDFITPHIDGVIYFEKPPLLYWMQALMIYWFGINEWALRAPTAFMALIGCLATYTAGRLLFSRTTGILSALILAASPLYFAMAHSITLDMTVSVWLTIALFAFIIGVRLPYPSKERQWTMWLMYAASAMAMMTKGLIGIAFPGMIVLSWLLLFNQWRQLKQVYLVSGLVLFFIIVLPWHIMVQLRNPEFFNFYFIDQHFVRFLTKDMGRYKPIWWFIPIFIAGFFPWVVFLIQSCRDICRIDWLQRDQKQVEIFLLLWAIEIFIFFSISNSKLIPYIVPVFPPVALLVGNYLASKIKQEAVMPKAWLMAVLMAIIFAMTAFSASYWHKLPNLVAQQKLDTMAGILIIFALGLVVALWKRASLTILFSWSVLLQIIFLWSLVWAVPSVDKRPIKPLALYIQQLAQPNDIIASYNIYYQDLPVYTQRFIKIVDWRNELAFGYQHQDSAKNVMINADQFWQLWCKPQRIFVVMDRDDYKANQAKYRLFIIARHGDDYLLSNQQGA